MLATMKPEHISVCDFRLFSIELGFLDDQKAEDDVDSNGCECHLEYGVVACFGEDDTTK